MGKKHHPEIKIYGGGFPNTELRSLSNFSMFFEFFDYIAGWRRVPVEELCKMLLDSSAVERVQIF
jgi:hypothetical protein